VKGGDGRPIAWPAQSVNFKPSLRENRRLAVPRSTIWACILT
jgi:hypothetical protein